MGNTHNAFVYVDVRQLHYKFITPKYGLSLVVALVMNCNSIFWIRDDQIIDGNDQKVITFFYLFTLYINTHIHIFFTYKILLFLSFYIEKATIFFFQPSYGAKPKHPFSKQKYICSTRFHTIWELHEPHQLSKITTNTISMKLF